MYSFDKVIERKGTECEKYDDYTYKNVPEVNYPLWIADMDFETAPVIMEALQERMKHQVFGYSVIGERYYTAIKEWHKRRYNVTDLKDEHICYQSGVLAGLCHALDLLTQEGESVMIQTPAYVGFIHILENMYRKIIENPMKETNGYYEVDFIQFEEAIVANDVKVFIHCNPHNPAGRIWTAEEMQKIVDICKKHNVMILADEIWADMIINKEMKHLPLLVAVPEAKDITIAYYSPSKGFNLAGMWSAYSVCYNPELAARLEKQSNFLHSNVSGVLSIETTIAAYEKGDQWLDECIEYGSANMDYIVDFLAEKLPKIKLRKPDATYLLWLDFSELGLSHEEFLHRLYTKAGVLCNNGEDFMSGGTQHIRLNPMTSRTVIEGAMAALEREFGEDAK